MCCPSCNACPPPPPLQVIQVGERQKIQERRTLERRQSMSESRGSRHDSVSSASDTDDRRALGPPIDADDRDRLRGQWDEDPGLELERWPVPPVYPGPLLLRPTAADAGDRELHLGQLPVTGRGGGRW